MTKLGWVIPNRRYTDWMVWMCDLHEGGLVCVYVCVCVCVCAYGPCTCVCVVYLPVTCGVLQFWQDDCEACLNTRDAGHIRTYVATSVLSVHSTTMKEQVIGWHRHTKQFSSLSTHLQ